MSQENAAADQVVRPRDSEFELLVERALVSQTLDREQRRPRGLRALGLRTLDRFRSSQRMRLQDEVELERMHGLPPEALTERAAASAAAGDVDRGWKYIHRARQLAAEGYTGEQLSNAIIAVQSEAEQKLHGWRKETVKRLLATPTAPAVTGTTLAEAMRVLDEHSENVYFRNRLLRTQMTTIGTALVVLLIILLFVVDTREPMQPEGLRLSTVALSMLLGAIAAALSALMTFCSTSTVQTIPEHLAHTFVTVTRPLVGAASGLVGLIAIQSNIVNLPKGVVGWIVPFLFGFSERFVYRALQAGAPQDGEKKDRLEHRA